MNFKESESGKIVVDALIESKKITELKNERIKEYEMIPKYCILCGNILS